MGLKENNQTIGFNKTDIKNAIITDLIIIKLSELKDFQ